MADPLPEFHMPKPSFWPLGLALGATLLAAESSPACGSAW